MRRRDLIGLIAGAMVPPPIVVAAQQNATKPSPARVPQIGFIALGSRDENQGPFEAFRQGLRALSGEEGSNPVILDRWAEGEAERLHEIAKQVIGSHVDVLVTVGTSATLAARRASSRVPIVFLAVADPVGHRIINSLARPGGNATGLSLDSLELVTTRLKLLQELVPKLSRLAVIVRNDPGLDQRSVDIRRIAERMGIGIREFEAPKGQALGLAFRWLVNDRSDAVYVASGPLGPAKRAEIVALAAKAHIPAIYPSRAFPAVGGLMSCGTDEKHLFRGAAIFVEKILNGAKPSELPVEQPTKLELTVNMATAKALGLTIPPSILARANEVME